MVPIEYATGGAASVLHNKSEGTEEKHAYKVAYVKRRAYHKEDRVVYYVKKTKSAYNGDKRPPQNEDLVGRARGGNRVSLDCLVIYLFSYRTEALAKELQTAKRKLLLYGYNLTKHIEYPNKPQKM